MSFLLRRIMNIINTSVLLALAALLCCRENSFANNYQHPRYQQQARYQQLDSLRDQQQHQQRSNWSNQNSATRDQDNDDDDDNNDNDDDNDDDEEQNMEKDELNNTPD